MEKLALSASGQPRLQTLSVPFVPHSTPGRARYAAAGVDVWTHSCVCGDFKKKMLTPAFVEMVHWVVSIVRECLPYSLDDSFLAVVQAEPGATRPRPSYTRASADKPAQADASLTAVATFLANFDKAPRISEVFIPCPALQEDASEGA